VPSPPTAPRPLSQSAPSCALCRPSPPSSSRRQWEDTVAPAPSPNPPEKKHAWAADYPEDTAPSRADWVGDEAERSTGSEDDYNEDPPATSGPVPGAGVTVAGAESAGAVARAYGSQAQGAAWATRTPLPRVLVVHTGGTLGMDSSAAPVPGGSYEASLSPAKLLVNLKQGAPEIGSLAHVDLKVAFNRDSSRVGPAEWVRLAKTLDGYRDAYDSFVVIHGTDTLSYTASALSLMLLGFGKPIVLTGSQLPLSELRSDARQNLIDAVTVATAGLSPASSPGGGLEEVVVVFGGRVLRGNRSQKTHSSIYQAFDSPGYPHLARLGIQIAWNREALLPPRRAYTPRLKRVPLDHEERASSRRPRRPQPGHPSFTFPHPTPTPLQARPPRPPRPHRPGRRPPGVVWRPGRTRSPWNCPRDLRRRQPPRPPRERVAPFSSRPDGERPPRLPVDPVPAG